MILIIFSYSCKAALFSGTGTNNSVYKNPVASLISFLSLYTMLPDYPHKIFADKRRHYNLLMEVLAMDAVAAQ